VIRTTETYLRADPSEKLEAVEAGHHDEGQSEKSTIPPDRKKTERRISFNRWRCKNS
jgi:hypothetical protein